MPEFTESYMALMREKRLEHGFREGDWYGYYHEPVRKGVGQGWRWSAECFPWQWDHFHEKSPAASSDLHPWLPLEGDWLEMLEKAGTWWVRLQDERRFEKEPGKAWSAECSFPRVLANRQHATGPTRLEALARLYLAVTEPR